MDPLHPVLTPERRRDKTKTESCLFTLYFFKNDAEIRVDDVAVVGGLS